MSDVVDAQVQQNALFYNIDIIYDKIINNPALVPNPKPKITLFNKDNLGKKMSRGDAGSLMINQGHIFSGFSAPTEESAEELFSDPRSDDFFIDTGYDIEHNIIIFLPVEISGRSTTRPYYFNIDETNRLANPDGVNGSFFITKVEIINRSKDAFTIRSNYQVIFKIAFNYFEDLKDKKIKVRSVQKGLPDKEICLLQVLYPAYRVDDPAVNNDAIKNRHIESKDKYGVILNQVLNMNDKKYFAKTIEGFDGTTKIHKNYHLTYLKHEFEMFKSNYSVLIPFENELTINYIAFEAEPKPQVKPEDDTFFTDSINRNLYEINSEEAKYAAFFNTLKDYNNAVKNLEAAINCIKLGKQLTPDNLLKDKVVKALSDRILNLNGDKQKFIEEARSLVKSLTTSIQQLKKLFNLYLYQKILEKLTFYEIKLNYDELIDYRTADFSEEFFKNFADGFSTAAGAGATIGTLFGPEGTIVGAGVGTAAAAATAAYKAWTSSGEVYEQSVLTLRQAFKRSNITKTNALNATGGVVSFGAINVNLFLDKSQRELVQRTDQKVLDGIQETIKKLTEIEVKDEDILKEFQLKFTFFGELLNILYPLITSEIVLGGKCVPVNENFEQMFLNYYYIPISEAALIKFLKSKILDRDNFSYPIEEYIKDITENLLKNAIMNKNVVNDFFKEYVPSTVNSYAFPHITRIQQPTGDLRTALQKDMTIEQNVKSAKKQVIKTNYINVEDTSGIARISKYYAIVGGEQIKYTDFYKMYSNAFTEKYKNTSFQDYIIKKFYMPCLRIKSVDAFGSILKTKNLNFKRMDNQNLQTALMLDGSPIFRVPYEIEGEFKAYMYFFLDIAGMLFVSPPDRRDGAFNSKNTFGYSGLYLIKSCKFEYTFQNANGMSITAPNNTAKVLYGGYMLTYGDAYSATIDEAKKAKEELEC